MENKQPKPNTKAAIYSRVSTIDKGQTLEQQEDPLIEYCKREGWEYEIFKDFASGGKESRPELDKMMKRVRSREFDCVIIYRLDRLGRSLKHMLQIVEELDNYNVRFICYTMNIDTQTSTGKFMLQVLGASAEFERQLIRERIKDKLSNLKKRGKKLGRPKGKKDTKRRRKAGYYERWQREKTPERKK